MIIIWKFLWSYLQMVLMLFPIVFFIQKNLKFSFLSPRHIANLPNKKMHHVNVTSVDLLTSIHVSYRAGIVNVNIDWKGDNSRNYICWDMKFFMLKYYSYFQTWKLTKRAVFSPWKLHISANTVPPIISLPINTSVFNPYTIGYMH